MSNAASRPSGDCGSIFLDSNTIVVPYRIAQTHWQTVDLPILLNGGRSTNGSTVPAMNCAFC
jgi:hypothetical protein